MELTAYGSTSTKKDKVINYQNGFDLTEITRIAVISVGTMGHGIAQVTAQVGTYEVYMYDLNQQLVNKGTKNISNNLQKAVTKNSISQRDICGTLDRIHSTTDLENAVSNAECDRIGI